MASHNSAHVNKNNIPAIHQKKSMFQYLAFSFAIMACLLSSILLYLSSPNQQWLQKRPMGFLTASSISLTLCVLSWFLFRVDLSVFSATFTVVSLMMLSLGILPFFSSIDAPAKSTSNKKKRIQKQADAPYKPHWVTRIACATILGYPLAVGLSSLLLWSGGNDVVIGDRTQLIMWLITPIWLTGLSLIFFVTRINTVVIGYSGLNLIIYTLIYLAGNSA